MKNKELSDKYSKSIGTGRMWLSLIRIIKETRNKEYGITVGSDANVSQTSMRITITTIYRTRCIFLPPHLWKGLKREDVNYEEKWETL